jgi:hypothetical protein
MQNSEHLFDGRLATPVAYIAENEAHARVRAMEALLERGFVCREFSDPSDPLDALRSQFSGSDRARRVDPEIRCGRGGSLARIDTKGASSRPLADGLAPSGREQNGVVQDRARGERGEPEGCDEQGNQMPRLDQHVRRGLPKLGL